MNILLSTDNNYVMPTGVLMHSIGENNDSDVVYYIMCSSDFTEENRLSLTHIAEKYGNKILFYTITDEMTMSLPFNRDDQPHHVSIATYYRLFISNILPIDVHKVLYLDGDMIVRKSLQDLWNTDLTDYAVGVVHDMDEPKQCSGNRLPYDMSNGYFNAGMLLVNLDYWRRNNCYDNFMIFIKKHEKEIQYHDQDVLNCVFENKKKYLPVIFNFQSGFLYRNEFLQYNENLRSEVESCKFDPVILHFCAPDKPWHLECFHTYCKDWRKYFFLSEWKSKKLVGEEPKSLKDRFRNYLVRHCWYVPATLYQTV